MEIKDSNQDYKNIKKLNNLLDKRYKICDSKGHNSLNNNYCNFCYRHENNIDNKIIIKYSNSGFDLQKLISRVIGIKLLSNELIQNNKLEKIIE